MTASDVSQGPGESPEVDAEKFEPEGIARVIYIAPVVVAVERGGRAGMAESMVELKDGGG